MAFMLGSFTGGMFSGFQGVMQGAQMYQGLKEAWAMEDGANAVKDSMDTDRVNKNSPGWQQGTGTGGMPKPQDMSATSAPDYQGSGKPEVKPASTSAEPPKIDLDKVPKPKHMMALPTPNTAYPDAGGATTGTGAPKSALPVPNSDYPDAQGATVGASRLPTPSVPFADAGGATVGPGGSPPPTPTTPGPVALTTSGIRRLQPGQSGVTMTKQGLRPTGPYRPQQTNPALGPDPAPAQAVPTAPPTPPWTGGGNPPPAWGPGRPKPPAWGQHSALGSEILQRLTGGTA